MKSLIVMALILTGAYAKAQCCPTQCEQPKPKPKVITRTKVVEKVVEKPVPVVKEVVKVVDRPVPVHVTKTVVKRVQKKNRISVLGGTGPTDLDVTPLEARLERGLVFGVQYQRMLSEDLSIGVQVQSNETVLGSVGIDF
jgi:hypothetical protein